MFNFSEKAIKSLQLILATVLGSLFLVQLAGSIFWRQYLDTPLLNYVGFLINEQGLIPYAEIFETSMPGTFLFHTVLGKIAGYSDLAVRITDIFALLVCLALIYLVIKPAGKIQGAIASLVCGLAYLAHGSRIALQRDFLGLIPVFAAILALQASSKNKISQNSSFFITGLLIGISASFKPHLAIVWPVLLFFLPPENIFFKGIRGLKPLGLSIVGFIVTFFIPIIWVWNSGGLNSFLKIFFNYLPLHTQLGHDFQLIPWP
ncbi:MAG: glycosyltransferase family 39 protein, partial [Candidatus Rifleibacteriota bacterium]